MISFYLDGKHVRFELNPMSFEQGGLYVSAQVLKLARIVSARDN